MLVEETVIAKVAPLAHGLHVAPPFTPRLVAEVRDGQHNTTTRPMGFPSVNLSALQVGAGSALTDALTPSVRTSEPDFLADVLPVVWVVPSVHRHPSPPVVIQTASFRSGLHRPRFGRAITVPVASMVILLG